MVHRRTPTQSVLLVDDDEDCRFMYATALAHAGFRVTVADTGTEGIQRAAALHPDVILMDLHLPDLDGEEAARIIRADPATAATPIIAITARIARHERAELLAAGFADALLKPIYPAQVVEAVRAWFVTTGDE